MGLEQLTFQFVFLISLVLPIFGEDLLLINDKNETHINGDSAADIQQLPPPFMRNFCKQNTTTDDHEKVACIQWFETALDHCDDLLRIGKFQPPKIFDPENAYEIDGNLSIATNANTLSSLDCKFIIGRLATDYIEFEPQFEFNNYRIQLLLASITLIWTTMIIGASMIWWKKCKKRHM